MKETKVPKLPFDVLAIHSWYLKILIKLVLRLADTFGFWRHPKNNSATKIEEMGPLDNLYWIYKSKNFVELPQPEVEVSIFDHVSDNPHQINAIKNPKSSVQVSMVGDILRSPDFDQNAPSIFANISKDIFEADLSIANFESPVSYGKLVDEIIGQDGPPTECCSEEQFDALTSYQGKRFDVLNLANNHILDLGPEGLENTLNVMRARDIQPIGVNDDIAASKRPHILTINDIKFGIVSFTFGLNGHTLDDSQKHRVNVTSLTPKKVEPKLDDIIQQIEHARENQCDVVIVSLHWGFEFELFPRANQIAAAQKLAEAGADAIIGHHPHVAQPVQFYQTQRDPSLTVPIAYSLGSLNWRFLDPTIATSKIIKLEIKKNADKTRVTDVSVIEVIKTQSDRAYCQLQYV